MSTIPDHPSVPITEAVVYELDFDSREWLTGPIPTQLSRRLRALCELWRGEHSNCRFAMLLTLGSGQYSLRYFAGLDALASAIHSTDELASGVGAKVPWRLEILPASTASLSALLLAHEAPGAASRTH